MVAPNKGVRLSVDVGTVRIGVARCDLDQMLAVPVSTIQRTENSVSEILNIAEDYKAEIIYVGKPISLNQNETKSTQMAVDFANQLASMTRIAIRLLDERLTTVSAQTTLHNSGKNSKNSRSVIDQVAAVILLDHALAVEKASGTLAGEQVHPDSAG